MGDRRQTGRPLLVEHAIERQGLDLSVGEPDHGRPEEVGAAIVVNRDPVGIYASRNLRIVAIANAARASLLQDIQGGPEGHAERQGASDDGALLFQVFVPFIVALEFLEMKGSRVGFARLEMGWQQTEKRGGNQRLQVHGIPGRASRAGRADGLGLPERSAQKIANYCGLPSISLLSNRS